ncbi:protein ROLLING AND ERECT LEAF 2-like [Diospyros lotus]|uniref:protein ROLLING AND ERECT LEAF 2-like n=1 Tax=Diospyros lotus TaxID=55363 RepID=UPI002258E525|nr:protein ROLLING AND ERECT LEAF 2-like [Diospyros lotus]XP_052186578.1 protein ROLLING AND ERECT LEAF 2-like [Diospyros lotus]
MGATSSKIEEDKALQLCRERKKFVREALDGRCSLAATHVGYINMLRIVGTVLRKFAEPEAPNGSFSYTSASATQEPPVRTERSPSQLSLFSQTVSLNVDATESMSPSCSPTSGQYQVNHMQFMGSVSEKVEEKPSTPIMGFIASSKILQRNKLHSTELPETQSTETTPFPSETPPWDYFGLSHPIDNQFSSQDRRGLNLDQELDNANISSELREEEGISESEVDENKDHYPGRENSQEDSEDEFDEPSTDTLVRSYENINRALNHSASSASPVTPAAKSLESETEFLDGQRHNSPDLSPLITMPSSVGVPNDIRRVLVNADGPENEVTPKDFFSSMKEIENLFVKASECGLEVPRMLEANKFHFRPTSAGKERLSTTLTFFKNCLSCGEDLDQVQEEQAQTSVKYLTWHRTTSLHFSSSLDPSGTRDDIEDPNSSAFDNFCMTSGSHASTLDRLYAWERKLYDEVKASKLVRKEYDLKCKLLRQLESKGEFSSGEPSSRKFSIRIDKTRAAVKDLHSRIRVAIHRIDSISKKIEELRDTELQPQLEELIQGLKRMWEGMSECHALQFQIISDTCNNGNIKISLQSEAHREITIHLESELSLLISSFTNWIGAQKTYVKAINDWLSKCVCLPQQSSKRKRRMQLPPVRNYGPPIYVTCSVWLDLLDTLPSKDVVDSVRGLTTAVSNLLPRQKKQGKGMNPQSSSQQAGSNSEIPINLSENKVSEDWVAGSHRFQSSLVGFIGQLKNFAGSSFNMFSELERAIQEAKVSYNQFKSQP